MVGEDEPAVEFELKERAMDEAPVGITISDPDRPDNPVIYANDAFERLTGYPQAAVRGRNCRFLQGEASDPEAIREMAAAVAAERPVSVELVNYRADDEAFWNEVTIAPLRDDDGAVTNFVGFQNDITARKEAEFEVERRTRELEHLLDRINGLLKDGTEVLVQSTTRDAHVRGVVERLAATDPYVFAWFGDVDLVSETLLPVAWAGDGASLDDVEIAVSADDPTARAFQTRETHTASVPGTACADHTTGAQSLAAVPVMYRGTVYGVVTVYATDEAAFDERETVVIEALARTLGTALNARESQRIITASNVVELEFEIRDPGLFVVDLSVRCDCRLEHQGSINLPDEALSLFFSTDAPRAALLEWAAAVPDIEHASVVSGDDESNLVEIRLAAGSLVAELAQRGVKTRSITAEDGTARLSLELPPEAEPRAIATLVRDRYPESDLVASREHDRPPTTQQEFISAVADRLTDQQVTALQKAYLSGYYAPNRATTGNELAASMDISRATFHQHLRAAERKLVQEFFDGNG
ncbi:bacterio-opsin activator domain-containing protein [Halorarius litoreus]|uniref:bacterio-opsin activator domain-containing protein n=1 Tax=Halorarius litoreus TaxID=2962676 RepID=UPI0020CD6222|nr:bacterio-opsin activator domain-containing protein [Halorarius litoreus]